MKKKLSVCSIIGLVSFGLGYYVTPTKTVIRTETKEVVREVERKSTEASTKKRNNRTYIKVETILPDGTRNVETRIVDNGVITIDASSSSNSSRVSDVETSTEKTVTRNSPSLVYALASVRLSDMTESPDFGVGIHKQFIGPLWIGAYGLRSTTVGVTLGLGF